MRLIIERCEVFRIADVSQGQLDGIFDFIAEVHEPTPRDREKVAANSFDDTVPLRKGSPWGTTSCPQQQQRYDTL